MGQVDCGQRSAGPGNNVPEIYGSSASSLLRKRERGFNHNCTRNTIRTVRLSIGEYDFFDVSVRDGAGALNAEPAHQHGQEHF
jgi:hypothetical protein